MLPINNPLAVLRIRCCKLPFQEERDEMFRRLLGPTVIILDWDASLVQAHCLLTKLREELARHNTDGVHVALCELATNHDKHIAVLALAKWLITLSPDVLVPVFADADGKPCNPSELGLGYTMPDWQKPARFFGFANLEKVTPQAGSDFMGRSLVY